MLAHGAMNGTVAYVRQVWMDSDGFHIVPGKFAVFKLFKEELEELLDKMLPGSDTVYFSIDSSGKVEATGDARVIDAS